MQRDDSTAERRELKLAEEGGLDGLGASKEYDDELSEVRPVPRKRALSSAGTGQGDWSILFAKGNEIARQWKKKWDKDGLAGCARLLACSARLRSR